MSPPSRYTLELGTEICLRIAAGETLRGICRDPGMPPESTVRTWSITNIDGFAEAYRRARDLQLEHLADEVLDVADDGSSDWMERNDPNNPGYQLNGEHVQRSRLRVDSRKWLLSKLRPEKYGDRQTLTGAGGKDLIPDPGATDQRIMVLLLKAGLSPDEARRALDEADADEPDHA